MPDTKVCERLPGTHNEFRLNQQDGEEEEVGGEFIHATVELSEWGMKTEPSES